jgi:hypothetical protein
MLEELKFGEMTILISTGAHITIAAVVSGPKAPEYKEHVDRAVSDIEEVHADIVSDWDGDAASTRPMDEQMKKLVLGEYGEKIT